MEIAEIERLTAPIIEQESAELVDLEFCQESGRWILRFYLDKEGGITLDDCAYFSDRLGAALDEADAIKRAYVLEVSSPGINRIIKKDKDFERFSGKVIKLRSKLPRQGQRNFKGKLLGFQEGKVMIEAGGKDVAFALDDIDEARLDSEVDI